MTQSASYIHSRLFSVILLNWLSPGGIFQGYRHITLTVHPDDLFMASYLWNPSTHTNPFSDSLTYRLTANDLQQCAKYIPFPFFLISFLSNICWQNTNQLLVSLMNGIKISHLEVMSHLSGHTTELPQLGTSTLILFLLKLFNFKTISTSFLTLGTILATSTLLLTHQSLINLKITWTGLLPSLPMD